jgi:hypothetical protein
MSIAGNTTRFFSSSDPMRPGLSNCGNDPVADGTLTSP